MEFLIFKQLVDFVQLGVFSQNFSLTVSGETRARRDVIDPAGGNNWTTVT